jgi:hypothetical protein
MAHDCNPNYWEVEMRRITVLDHLGHKRFVKPVLYSKKLGMVTCTSHSSEDEKCKIAGLWSRSAWE